MNYLIDHPNVILLAAWLVCSIAGAALPKESPLGIALRQWASDLLGKNGVPK